MRTSAIHNAKVLTDYVPELERFWVRAPNSPLATAAHRREWFRVMQLNCMADVFTVHKQHEGTDYTRTSPVTEVRVKVPKSDSKARRGRLGEQLPDDYQDAYKNDALLDPATAKEYEQPDDATPSQLAWMQWEARQRRLIDEILYYDPDVVFLNEITRAQFNGPLWRAIRLQGYGGFFNSTRRGAKALQVGQSYDDDKWKNRIPWEEDVGNATFFHKGRFFPNWMPGAETPNFLPYLQMSGIKDRATACQLLACNVQLTPGQGKAAVAKREHEAKQILTVLEPAMTMTSEKYHQALFITGDFHNETEDEPCVTMLRDKWHSAYDVCGGPRWTTWHFRNPAKEEEQKLAAAAQEEEKKRLEASKADDGTATSSSKNLILPKNAIEKFEEERALMLARGVVKRTSDWMIFDHKRLSVIQALDIPSDEHISLETLLPNPAHPFHHMHLVADFTWNGFDVDVAPHDVGPFRSW